MEYGLWPSGHRTMESLISDFSFRRDFGPTVLDKGSDGIMIDPGTVEYEIR